MAKMYNLLKTSYNKDTGVPFMANLLYGAVTDDDALQALVKHALAEDNANSIEIADIEDKDHNIFYITYEYDFEKDFKHGFKIQVLDTDDASQSYINKDSKEWGEWMEELITHFINKLEATN